MRSQRVRNLGEDIISYAHYRDMIANFFVPKLQGMCVENMWFQQDDATYLTAQGTINCVNFGARYITKCKSFNFLTPASRRSSAFCVGVVIYENILLFSFKFAIYPVYLKRGSLEMQR